MSTSCVLKNSNNCGASVHQINCTECNRWLVTIEIHHWVTTIQSLSDHYLRISRIRLTNSYLLKGGNQPECQICHSPLTVKHILIDCTTGCHGCGKVANLRRRKRPMTCCMNAGRSMATCTSGSHALYHPPDCSHQHQDCSPPALSATHAHTHTFISLLNQLIIRAAPIMLWPIIGAK